MFNLPKHILVKNKRAQFLWVMNNSTSTNHEELMFKAFELGTKLIGIMFSHQEMINKISKQFQVPHHYKKNLIKKNKNYIDKNILSQVKDSIYLTKENWSHESNIEFREILSLDEVVVDSGVITLLRAPMGEGKTLIVGRRECDKYNQDVLAVCHRITLVKELSNILNLTYYRSKNINKSEIQNKNIHGEKIERKLKETIKFIYRKKKLEKGLATCVNSIYKAKQLHEEPKLLLIDEIGQVIDNILTSTTMASRAKVYYSFKDYLKNTDFVLGMDAGLSDKDLQSIQELSDKKIIVYHMPENDSDMKVKIISIAQHGHVGSLILELALNSDEPFVLCSDNKAYIESAHTFLTDHDLNGITVTGDNKKTEIMGDLNGYIEKKKPKFLLYSPAISSGVSITIKHFKHIFCVYHLIIPPTDLMQMLKRVRTVNDVSLAIVKTSGGSLRDVNARAVGYQQISGASNDQIKADELLIQQLKCEGRISAQIKYAPFALYNCMVNRKWDVFFDSDTNFNQDDLNKVIEELNLSNEYNKQQFIVNVMQAEIIDIDEYATLYHQTSLSEKEKYKFIRKNIYFTTNSNNLKKEDVILLKNRSKNINTLISILNNEHQEDLADKKITKHELGHRYFPIEINNYLKSKNKIYNELFKAAGINLWNGPLNVNTNKLVNLLVEKRNICLAFNILQNIPRTTDNLTDSNITKLAQSFFRKIGLILRKTGELDIDRLRQIQTYANNHVGDEEKRPVLPLPNDNTKPVNNSVRGRQLEKLLEKNQYVALSPAWIKENLEFTKIRSAKKWLKKIKDNKYNDYYEFKIKAKYKNGRMTVRKFLTKYDNKNQLIEILNADVNFIISL